MSNNELKPTNEEIASYIFHIVVLLVGTKLSVNEALHIQKTLRNEDFSDLREMFVPVMYNSIEEWKENN